MAVWRVEVGTSVGRGVGETGLLGIFKAWVVKSGANGGPAWYIIDDQTGASDPYIVVSDCAAPAVNDYNTGAGGLPPKFIKFGFLASEAGFVRMQSYLWWDATTHTGRGLWYGKRIPTYDAASFEYRFRGGQKGMIFSIRLLSTWKSAGIVDVLMDSVRYESVTKYGILQSGVSAGNDVVLQLGSGQAANFTVNKREFIFCMNGHSWVNRCKVTNVDTGADQITVSNLSYNFPAGAVIASFPHRFLGFGSYFDNNINDICGYTIGAFTNSSYSKMPYNPCTTQENVHHDQSGPIYGSVRCDILENLFDSENPDEDGDQTGMAPYLSFYGQDNTASGSRNSNRGIGQPECIRVFRNNSFVVGSDGKTAEGLNYTHFGTLNEFFQGGSSQTSIQFLETESAS